MSATAAPISGQDSARKQTLSDAILPDLSSVQPKIGYETHTGDSGVPRFGGAANKRGATGGFGVRPGQLAPIEGRPGA